MIPIMILAAMWFPIIGLFVDQIASRLYDKGYKRSCAALVTIWLIVCLCWLGFIIKVCFYDN